MTKKVLLALVALMFASVAFAQHDQDGEWKRVENSIRLFSTNSSPNADIIHDNNICVGYWQGKLQLYVSINGQATPTVVGSDEEGGKIVEIEMSFDDGEYGYFTFTQSTSFGDNNAQFINMYRYVLFDRFRKTVVRDANSMLKQMASKRTLTVRYKTKNGSTKTSTFNLEGLDAILELF